MRIHSKPMGREQRQTTMTINELRYECARAHLSAGGFPAWSQWRTHNGLSSIQLMRHQEPSRVFCRLIIGVALGHWTPEGQKLTSWAGEKRGGETRWIGRKKEREATLTQVDLAIGLDGSSKLRRTLSFRRRRSSAKGTG